MKKLILTILMLTGLSLFAGLVDRAVVIGGKPVVIGGSSIYRETAWTPARITTLAWYDASDTNTLTIDIDETSVTGWDDKSPSGFDLEQSTGSLQPESGTRTLNGLNVIDFDADSMQTVSSGAIMPSATNFSIAVIQSDASTGAQQRFTDRKGAGGRWLWGFETGEKHGLFNGTSLTGSTEPTPALKIWGAEETGSGKNLYTNGVVQLSGASGTDTLDNGMKIGSNVANAQGLDGFIAEMIFVSGLVSTDTRQKIEGYLAWKWGLEGDLPIGHPYKSARPMLETPDIYFSPEDITTFAWYDASDESTITAGLNGYVSEWDDLSGNGYTVTNHAGASQPLSGTTTMYGNNVINFDESSGKYLQNKSFSTSTSYTMLIAFEDYEADSYYVLTDGRAVAPGNGWLNHIGNTNDTTNYRYVGGLNSSYSTAIGSHVISVVIDGASSTLNVDGNQATGTASYSMEQLTIGNNFIGSFQTQASIGEVIFVDSALSDADRQKLEGYLAWKWGLRDSLSSDHPYKYYRPRKIE